MAHYDPWSKSVIWKQRQFHSHSISCPQSSASYSFLDLCHAILTTNYPKNQNPNTSVSKYKLLCHSKLTSAFVVGVTQTEVFQKRRNELKRPTPHLITANMVETHTN